MKKRALLPAILLTLAGIILATPAKAAPLSQAETDVIVVRFQTAYDDTFNRRDARGMAVLFTENATLQNEWGGITQGRAKIEPLLTGLMAHLPAGTKLEDTALVSQEVAPGVIVSQGISHRTSPTAAPAELFFTRILVRHGDLWLLAATQIARPSTYPKPTSPPSK